MNSAWKAGGGRLTPGEIFVIVHLPFQLVAWPPPRRTPQRTTHRLQQKEDINLKSGTCPKCASKKVYSGASIPLKKGPFGSNSIPISLTSVAALDNYVCSACGYVESYVSDGERLGEIAQKWVHVKDVDAPKDAAEQK